MTGPGSMAQVQQVLDAIERGPMSEDDLAWMRQVGDAVHSRKKH
jgi:hypothetical protein